MRTSPISFDQFMRRIPDLVQLALGLCFIAGLTAFKLTLGSGVMLIDFLMIPVVGVGWFASTARWGYLVAAVAAVDSAVLAVYAETQASWQTAFLTGFARFALYTIVLALLGMMRRERAGHQWAAATDRKTGAVNAHTFHERAQVAVQRAQRCPSELSLAYVDLDDFKAINDELGHEEGDRVLFGVSHVMRAAVRATDTVGRVGGDEFAILMPETGAKAARKVVDRLRDELARVRTFDDRRVPCSIGLVTFDHPPASLGELINAGDELMYRAKRSGKDRIEQAERSGVAAPMCSFNPGERWQTLKRVPVEKVGRA
jgi:diguanylate cyclase (GGDEF)-like protein